MSRSRAIARLRRDAADNNTGEGEIDESSISGHHVIRLSLEGSDVAPAVRRPRLEPLIEAAGTDGERDAVDRRTTIAQRHNVPRAAVETSRAKTR